MTRHEKLIAALIRATKKAKDKTKLQEKIKKVQQQQAHYNWLAQ